MWGDVRLISQLLMQALTEIDSMVSMEDQMVETDPSCFSDEECSRDKYCLIDEELGQGECVLGCKV